VPETVVYLVRHGQVENPRRVLYGRLPGYHLSSRGQAQADLLAGHFAEVPVAAVVASPLERAQQTAIPIAAAHGLEVRTDLRLIETSNIFEGVAGNVAWYIVRHPRLWWKLRDLRAPSWGERNVDMVERVHAVVDAVREEFAGRQVVLVSHQAPIWVARLAFERRRLTHWPGFRRCTLASVTTLAFDGDQLTRVSYAEPAASALLGPAPSTRPGEAS
jgi:broad specificity phosphatase PhoE